MIEETVEDFEKPFQEQTREMHASITFEAPRNIEAPISTESIEIKQIEKKIDKETINSEAENQLSDSLKKEEKIS